MVYYSVRIIPVNYIYVPGNRVIHIRRPEFGIGEITKIQNYSKKETTSKSGWMSDVFAEVESSKENFSISEDVFQKYAVNFSAYLEKNLFQSDIRHFVWNDGEKVKIGKEIGTIINHNFQNSSGLLYYDLLLTTGQTLQINETEIQGSVDSPIDEFLKHNISHPYTFFLRMWSHQISDMFSSNNLKIVSNARLSLMPHQISVASHLLKQGFARYILADEVGLGKTIEAGIYIKEMMARKLADRILIITPASITPQWEFEMANKFNLHFTRLNSKILKKSAVNFKTGTLVDTKTGQDLRLCTATLQYARMEQCSKYITQIEWDIVIFDEAHHLRRYIENQKTERYRTTLAYELAEKLADRTKSILLLSATPIQLHSFDLFSLIQILNRFEFPSYDAFETERRRMRLLNLVVKNLYLFTRLNTYERNALVPQIQTFEPSYSETHLNTNLASKEFRKKLISSLENHHFLSRYVIRNRRRKVFPKNKIKRIPELVDVELTTQELQVYNKIHQYLAKIYSENFTKGPAGIGFIMVILQKLLTSSVPAVLQTLRKRIKYLEENKDILEKLSQETETSREFMADESSLDVGYGLEEYELEDRLIFHARKKRQKPKKVKTLNINDHIKILKEFVVDLADLTFDSKATKLLAIIDEIYRINPKDKVLIFTQFKQTLFYLAALLQKKGIKVSEFHGDLSENQKTDAVQNFKKNYSVMLSTEIGGEGRNFQFCHIIINYDLPWNPMRLEQRIGRLDRIGQTHNVLIFNFYIRDTVESSIITAIMERINLFEESIGSLEPILGNLEGKIANIVLKSKDEPARFQLEELISKTDLKIEKVFDELDDFILDRRSFQAFSIEKEINQTLQISDLDILRYFQLISKTLKIQTNVKINNPDLTLNLDLLNKAGEMGIWKVSMSEQMRQNLRLTERTLEGTFRLDLAQKHEEYDFLALGHPLVMNLADWGINDRFGGFSTNLMINRQKWASQFLPPAAARLHEDEIELFKHVLKINNKLHLFFFEVEFIGIIIEKIVQPVIITPEGEVLLTPSISVLFIRHLLEYCTVENDYNSSYQFANHNNHNNQNSQINRKSFPSIPKENIALAYSSAQKELRTRIKHQAKKLIELNKQQYSRKIIKTTNMAAFQKKYAQIQLENAKLTLRAKKLKLPTERQLINLNSINNPHKKQSRLEEFEKREKIVKYYKGEVLRWEQILESLSFDLPAKLEKLEKFKQLWIDAKLIGYAQIQIV